MTSTNKTPRRLISEYLDASKTQILSPHRRQQRGTPDRYNRSKEVLSHDRVSSLRGKRRRSVSSLDEEETPRQLISQYIATADTATPLIRQGRRTSQSGVFQSQPAIPVSYKRPRQSSNFNNTTTDIDSETPRTLINRYLQNASQTVDTPVVRHPPSPPDDTPDQMLVQETYNTPSPFKESSQGSGSSIRMSARQRSRLNRSASKNLTGNYSLVIPETQGIASSPSTDKILRQTEFDMPSIFGSSDSEDEVPLPDISRYSKSRHHHGGYNLTVPETMLERSDYRERSELRDEDNSGEDNGDQITMGHDRYTDRSMVSRDRSVYRRSVDHRNRSDYQEEEYDIEGSRNKDGQMEDRPLEERGRMEERGRYEEDRGRMEDDEQYRVYELPMAPTDSVNYEESRDMYEDTLGDPNQHHSVHDEMARFSPRISSTQRSRTEKEETREMMRESMSRRSKNVSYDNVQMNTSRHSDMEDRSLHYDKHNEGRSQREIRSQSFGYAEHTLSHARSHRRSAPEFSTGGDMETSPIISGKTYRRGQNVPEQIHSIGENFSPRISSTQKTIYMEDPSRETTPPRMTSPMETITPSPVVSPDQESPNFVRGRESNLTSATRILYVSGSRSPQSARSRSRRGSGESIRIMPRSPLSSRSRSRSGESFRTRPMNMSSTGEQDQQIAGTSVIIPSTYNGGSDNGSVVDLGIRISTPSSVQKSAYQTLQSMKGSATKVSASTTLQRTPSSREAMSRTPQSMSRTTRSMTPQSRSRTPNAVSRTQTSISRTPQSMSRTPQSQPIAKTPQSRSRISQSISRTPLSRSQTPRSTNNQTHRDSPRSPVVAGRMSRQPNRDMVHTLPNNTAFFSPQVSSTQELAAVSRRSLLPDDDNVRQQEPVEDMDNQKEADGTLPNVEENIEDREPEEDVEKENQAEVENDQGWEDDENMVNEELARPAEVAKKPQKAPRKPRAKNPYIIPINRVKKSFSHYAGMRVDKDAVKSVMDISEKYWTNLAADLTAYAHHAGRKKINMADMKLLFKRQGHVTERQSLTALIEKHLPMEEREKLIPCARAFNKIELNRKYI